MTYDNIINLLKSKDYKITTTRQVIIKILIKNIHTLLTVDELHDLIQRENHKINRSTIYRNLDTLIDLGLLFHSLNNCGQTRYKLICTPHHHHHLICDFCGKIEIYDICNESLYTKFAKEKGFILTGHTLELHGICKNCQRTL